MKRSVFARARWATAVAVVLAAVAIIRYPGGTTLDHSTVGYTAFQNFLSDLGMTVAFNGQPNRLGAACFVASLMLLVLGLGASFFGFIKLYSTRRGSRLLARGAGAVGLLVCAAFTGVAVTPENKVMAVHYQLTRYAWRGFFVAAILLTLAAFAYSSRPLRVPLVWALLAATLAAYVAIFEWGPQLSTVSGLEMQVIAQKVMATAAILVLIYQGFEAERRVGITTSRQPPQRDAAAR